MLHCGDVNSVASAHMTASHLLILMLKCCCVCVRNSRPQVKALLPEVCDVADRLLDKWTAIANHGQGKSSRRIHIVL
jgi:hypothetical protein